MKQGWEIKRLGEVCEIINGFAFKSQLFKDSGDDILRISNIQNGVIDDSDIAHFSKEDYPKVNFEKYAVLPEDIVVALSGATTGKFGINNTGRKLYLNQRVAICREKTTNLHHLFLLYFLQTQSKSFLESAAGVAQPNLSTEQMKQYDIPVPPLPEQEKIVAELDCLSGIIEKKRQQLKELDALAQAIFYEMFGDPVTNEKGWEVKKLGDIANISSGGTPSRKNNEYFTGSINWYSAGELNSLYLSDSVEKITEEAILKSAAKIFRANSLMVGMYDTAAFKLGILKQDSASNQACANVDLYSDNVVWMYYLLTLMREEALKHRHGIRQKNLNVGFIKSFIIPLPPLPLQQTFASKIEAIEKQKALIKQSLGEVETLFNARMQEYFG